jgi:hypothetical protein
MLSGINDIENSGWLHSFLFKVEVILQISPGNYSQRGRLI